MALASWRYCRATDTCHCSYIYLQNIYTHKLNCQLLQRFILHGLLDTVSNYVPREVIKHACIPHVIASLVLDAGKARDHPSWREFQSISSAQGLMNWLSPPRLPYKQTKPVRKMWVISYPSYTCLKTLMCVYLSRKKVKRLKRDCSKQLYLVRPIIRVTDYWWSVYRTLDREISGLRSVNNVVWCTAMASLRMKSITKNSINAL